MTFPDGLIGLVGTMAGVIAIPLAVYFYLKSKTRTGLAVQAFEFVVIGGTRARFPTELEISFAGEPVERVTSSRVVVWNNGNTTIDALQLLPTDQLRLELATGRILRSAVIRESRSVNAINLEHEGDSNRVLIDFAFVDPQDGFVISVLHTGDQGDLKLNGTIKGMPKGFTRYSKPDVAKLSAPTITKLARTRFFRAFPIFLGFCMMLFGAFAHPISVTFARFNPNSPVEDGVSWGLVLGGTIYAGTFGAILWSMRRRYPASLLNPIPSAEGETHEPDIGHDDALK